jgi:hypothetical protein
LTEDEPDFEYSYFQTQYEQNPQRLFDRVLEALSQRDRYHEQLEAQDEQVNGLIQERDEIRDKLLQLILTNRESAPASSHKSTKLPDPLPLTDGTEPTFEDWLSRIKDKLQVNADHYPTDQIQRAYVIGRISGAAAKYIAPRLRSDTPDPYQNLDDLFKHLSAKYEDPNRIFNAKDAFKKLSMKKDQTFHEFYSQFTQLANEAQISPTDLKYELNYKLSFDLQKHVLREFRDPQHTLREFADYCTVADQSLRSINERQNKTRDNRPNRNQNTSQNQNSEKKPSYEAGPRLDRTPMEYIERQQLMKEGKCFYCKATGHRIYECPKKPAGGFVSRSTAVKEIEQVGESESEPGNAYP